MALELGNILGFNRQLTPAMDVYNQTRQAIGNIAQTNQNTAYAQQQMQQNDPMYWIQKYKNMIASFAEDSPEHQYAQQALGGLVANAASSPFGLITKPTPAPDVVLSGFGGGAPNNGASQ